VPGDEHAVDGGARVDLDPAQPRLDRGQVRCKAVLGVTVDHPPAAAAVPAKLGGVEEDLRAQGGILL
jgi:hypothetical protein